MRPWLTTASEEDREPFLLCTLAAEVAAVSCPDGAGTSNPAALARGEIFAGTN
jgi:hypothetical protein